MSRHPLRVAIIGASGIGKNHARWFHSHGCHVCAFAGSSPETLEGTRKTLHDGFGFTGRGYSDVGKMLAEEKPEAVCIASPPQHHFNHVQACLETGAHVLCEKPLVYDATLTAAEMVRQARYLVQTAEAAGLVFGTQMQYATLVPHLLDMAGRHDPLSVRTFEMTMETKNLKPGMRHADVWIDLAPHPLSVLQKLAPGGAIAPDSIVCAVEETETRAAFTVQRPAGLTCQVGIITRHDPAAATPQRRFTIDGQPFDYAGRRDAEGNFLTYITTTEDCTIVLPDLVDTLIVNFISACRGKSPLLVTGSAGAQNIEWLLQVLAGATPANSA